MGSRRDNTFVIWIVVLLIAFIVGSGLGISMAFNTEDDSTENNTTEYIPVDVTHNVSKYENNSYQDVLNNMEPITNSSSNGTPYLSSDETSYLSSDETYVSSDDSDIENY